MRADEGARGVYRHTPAHDGALPPPAARLGSRAAGAVRRPRGHRVRRGRDGAVDLVAGLERGPGGELHPAGVDPAAPVRGRDRGRRRDERRDAAALQARLLALVVRRHRRGDRHGRSDPRLDGGDPEPLPARVLRAAALARHRHPRDLPARIPRDHLRDPAAQPPGGVAADARSPDRDRQHDRRPHARGRDRPRRDGSRLPGPERSPRPDGSGQGDHRRARPRPQLP